MGLFECQMFEAQTKKKGNIICIKVIKPKAKTNKQTKQAIKNVTKIQEKNKSFASHSHILDKISPQ